MVVVYVINMLNQLKADFQKLKNPKQAEVLQRFFKTGPGEYGEGDVFLGVKVPEQRKIARQYQDLALKDLQKLLASGIHEYRLTALFVLVLQYQKAGKKAARDQAAKMADAQAAKAEQIKIVNFYLKNARYVNNWDLVDSSAPYILGDAWLEEARRGLPAMHALYRLARSRDLWEKRIAMLATYGFIRQGEFKDALRVAEILLPDEHDLIHKAVGWMLREIGNRDLKTEEDFLRRHAAKMPRTMLRYAIEKFPEGKRREYLRK